MSDRSIMVFWIWIAIGTISAVLVFSQLARAEPADSFDDRFTAALPFAVRFPAASQPTPARAERVQRVKKTRRWRRHYRRRW